MVSLPAPLTSLSISELLILLPLIAFPVYLIGRAYFTLPPASSSGSSSSNNSTSSSDGNTKDEKKEVKSVMQPPNADLQPPKDDPFTPEELQKYDGTDAEGSIYVAIKGALREFEDVSHELTRTRSPTFCLHILLYHHLNPQLESVDITKPDSYISASGIYRHHLRRHLQT